MLKLVTQPRSRRKREWWHVTPGRSGACSVPPPPAEGPTDLFSEGYAVRTLITKEKFGRKKGKRDNTEEPTKHKEKYDTVGSLETVFEPATEICCSGLTG